MEKEKVSICIPVYNAETTIYSTIQSALNQTETLTFNTTTDYDSYKVMVFNSIDNCVPLTMTE